MRIPRVLTGGDVNFTTPYTPHPTPYPLSYRVPEPSAAWGTLALVGAFGVGSVLKRLPKASRKLIN
ncbi:hypothetical protein BJP37_02040 [Moorena bouillonii PNG]|uniref:PEP-CTERM protein-sorting domain-containing protein n=1 Tax=Moorena bouillonii PNG TaxID=568701 RepID=A0A1U7MWI6_9CYAN|nr:hypothetical protein BJP37_02040 [Moorena bouillonii PNG]